ncbi:MAG: O-antigen ligase family protein, partial [Candidatus Polarisedimenticolia bacterium]
MMGAAEARSGVRLEAAAAIVAAALASAFPPEAYPEAGALACVLAALAALRLGSSFVAVGVALSVLAFNAAVSLAPLRTLAVVAGALPLLAVFLCARRFAPRERRALAWSLVGAAQAALGVAQRLFLLRRMAAAAAAAGAPADVVARLADQRPFGTETLPAALGGLLVLALAACGLLWRGASRKWLVAAAAVLLASALALTGSFGALLGGAAGLLALLAFSTLRRRRAAWIVALVAVAALFAGVLAARPMHDLGLSNPRNPLRLRAGNWRGAVVAARERPVTGLGLGGFGAVYPNVARPDDLPTVYAHNAWLQLAVEGGLPAAAALAAGAWWAWRRRRALADQERRFAAAAVVAFVAHNLFDFTLFLPGVSWAAAALAGIAFGDDGPTVEPRETASSSSPDDAWNAKARRVVRVAAVGGLAALIAAGGAWYALEARARRALDRADAAFVAGDAAGAARDALTAARSPLASPALQLDAGRLLLAAAPKSGGTAAAAAPKADGTASAAAPQAGGPALAAAADVAARLKRFDP